MMLVGVENLYCSGSVSTHMRGAMDQEIRPRVRRGALLILASSDRELQPLCGCSRIARANAAFSRWVYNAMLVLGHGEQCTTWTRLWERKDRIYGA